MQHSEKSGPSKCLDRSGMNPSDVPNRAFVCSEHFDESDIDRNSLYKIRLRENALPIALPEILTYNNFKNCIKKLIDCYCKVTEVDRFVIEFYCTLYIICIVDSMVVCT